MQTGFQSNFNQLMLGMITSSKEVDAITLMPTEAMDFGIAATRGTAEGSVSKIAVDATSAKVVGVTSLRQNELGRYSINEEARIVTGGSVVVEVLSTDTIGDGDNAYMIVAATNYGKFTKTAGANTVACGVFQTAKQNSNLAVIKFAIIA